MKSDWAAEITAINNKHSAAMNEEKEKAMRVSAMNKIAIVYVI